MKARAGNIGPKERAKRLVIGLVLLAAGFGAAWALIHYRVGRGWRYLLFLPFWGGMMGVLQAWGKTCVSLAARGLADMDRGPEEIADHELQEEVSRRAVKVYFGSLIASIVLTFFFAVSF